MVSYDSMCRTKQCDMFPGILWASSLPLPSGLPLPASVASLPAESLVDPAGVRAATALIRRLRWRHLQLLVVGENSGAKNFCGRFSLKKTQTFSNLSVRRRCCHGGPDPRRSLRRTEEILRKLRQVRQLQNEVTQTKGGGKKAWESEGKKKIKFSSRRPVVQWGERRSNGRLGIKFANVFVLFSFSWEEEDRRKLQEGERSQGGARTTNFLVIGGDSGRVLQSLLNSRSHGSNGKGGTGRNWLIVTGDEEAASADLVSQCECRKIYWRMP